MREYFNFINFLDTKNKQMLILFVMLMVFTVILEILSISLILPVLHLLSQNEINPVVSKFFLLFNDYKILSSKYSTELIAILFLLAIFLIKNLFLIILFWFQSKFIFEIRRLFSLKNLDAYLNRPFLFFIKRNVSELLRILIEEIHIFTGGIREILILVTELLILVGLLIFLLIYNFKLTLILLASFSIFGIIYSKIISKKLFRWGEKRIFYENKKIKVAKASLDGIKELKLSNSENFFKSKFAEHNTNSALMRRWQSFVDNLPRITLEIYFIFSVLVTGIFFNFNNISFKNILITLGLFIAVGLRLIPSINRIFTCLQNLKYKKTTFQLINAELKKTNYNQKPKKFNKIFLKDKIEIKNLSFKYPGKSQYILKNLNLKINQNSVIGLIGKSGAGKSTLLSLITGLIKPDKGGIYLDNKNINENIKGWQNSIGYVPQKSFVLDGSIADNIAFGVDKKKIERNKIKKCLNIVNLKSFKKKMTLGEEGKNISGGQMQRIAIARAIYSSPKVLIIDEGLNSLDDKNSNKVLKAIKNIQNLFCVIIISHNTKHLKNCKNIFKLENGNLCKIK